MAASAAAAARPLTAAEAAATVTVVSRIGGLLDELKAHAVSGGLLAKVAFNVVPPEALAVGDPTAIADLAAAAIVLADPPAIAPFLDRCPALRWLHSTYAGRC